MISVNYQLPAHTGSTKKTCKSDAYTTGNGNIFIRVWYTDGHSKVQRAPSGLLR